MFDDDFVPGENSPDPAVPADRVPHHDPVPAEDEPDRDRADDRPEHDPGPTDGEPDHWAVPGDDEERDRDCVPAEEEPERRALAEEQLDHAAVSGEEVPDHTAVLGDGVPVLSVEALFEVVPGADLAGVLERGSLDGAADAAVVEAVAAWQRMVSWATAGAARAAAALAERASMNPVWPDTAGTVSEPNVAGEELAMRLSCSRRAARALVRQGRALNGVLAWTGDALARGEIDPARARVLVEALDRDVVPLELALEVQDAVLAGASGWTPTELSRQVAAALIIADPAGATTRHEAARRGRRVDRPRVLPDGMAGVWAVLDAADAVLGPVRQSLSIFLCKCPVRG
jgi:hypothetical protein